MTQAKGTKSSIAYMAESTFGALPATPALKQLYFISESLGEKMNLITSQVLRGNRNPTAPVRGNRDVSGSFRTELSPQLGTVLYGALGAKTSTPTSPYNAHVLKVGSDLPSFVFEKGFTDLDRYLLFLGCKVSRLGIAIKAEGFQEVSFDVKGAYEAQLLSCDAITGDFAAGLTVTGGATGHTALVKGLLDASPDQRLAVINPSGVFQNNEAITDSSTGAGVVNGVLGDTPIDAAYTDPGHTPFDGFQVAVIQEGGVDIAYLTAVDLTVENNLDGNSFVLGGGGIRRALPEGLVKVSGTITALFESMALYMKALNKLESSLKVSFSAGTGAGTAGNETLEIFVPELVLSKETPIIEGPAGILYKGPYEAYYANSSEASTIQITINNAEAAL